LSPVNEQKSSSTSLHQQLAAEIRRQLNEGVGADNLSTTLPSINLDSEASVNYITIRFKYKSQTSR